MNPNWTAIGLVVAFFGVGFLILFDQYLTIGVWFQLSDIHHETLTLSAFALASGILIGLSGKGKRTKRVCS